jgi:hypothetical protein
MDPTDNSLKIFDSAYSLLQYYFGQSPLSDIYFMYTTFRIKLNRGHES